MLNGVNPNVPIVGQRRVVCVCPRGHAEQLTGPFSIVMPSPAGPTAPPVQQPVCRLCFGDWLKWAFPVEILSPEDFAEMQKRQEGGDGEAA